MEDVSKGDSWEDDIDLDGVDEDNELVSYDSDNQDYVIKFKEYFAQRNADIIILSPNEFEEVGLPTYEAMDALMNPSERRGSFTRRIARVKIADSINYFLIKGVKHLGHGENEVIIGNALRSLNTLTCVGSLFGFLAANIYDQNSRLYYVVVPWTIGAIPLQSFISNKKPLKYNFSTQKCIRLFYPVLLDLVNLWNVAKFSHMDCKLDQVLFVPTADRLILVDFGLSSIDVIVEDKHIKVETRHISQTRTWKEDFCNFLNTCVHKFITCKCAVRDQKLITEWNRQKRRVDNNQLAPGKFLEWMKSV